MEQLSAYITNRMIDLDIICSDDKDFYCYSVQGLLEKISLCFDHGEIAVLNEVRI